MDWINNILNVFKDAARYRWLIQHGQANSKQSTRARIYKDELHRMVLVDFTYWCNPEEVHEAIDKAIKKKGVE